MELVYNQNNNTHYAEVLRHAELSDELVIASPFCFPSFSSFFEKIKGFHIERITFVTTLKDSEGEDKVESLISFYEGCRTHKIEGLVKIDNSLHGKVYVFKRGSSSFSALVTSANITDNGMLSNHEWGCLFSDHGKIAEMESILNSGVECSLDIDVLYELSRKLLDYNGQHTEKGSAPKPFDIKAFLHVMSLQELINDGTKIFLKPVGSSDAVIPSNRDFSDVDMQRFAKYPRSVSVGSVLISYAVGHRKIVSVFKTVGVAEKKNQTRWPWEVPVINLTPKIGANWDFRDLNIMKLVDDYKERIGSCLTKKGGDTLGALNFGCDKIQLDERLGRYLLRRIISVENN